jgi:ribosomal protein L7/L12
MNEPALLVFLAVVAAAAVLYWISPGEHRMPPPSMTGPAPPQPFHTAPSAPTFHNEPESDRFGHEHVSPSVIEALDRGDVLEAIKRLRKTGGVGLAEAKAAVDELRRRRTSHGFGPASAASAAAHVPPEVLAAIDRGETIQAIKRFREATGVGLAEAKSVVDEIRRRRGKG